MNITNGLTGLALFLLATASVCGAIFGWVVGWMKLGDWLDAQGAPKWAGQTAACFMPLSPVLFVLLTLVFFAAARS